MITFDIQRFDATYDVTDLVTVGQVKTLATRIATRLAALESPKAFKGVKIEDNKLKFYEGTDTTVTPLTYVDLLEELYLQGAQTDIVENFAFSAATYPGANDPGLDGKTVLVLAVKGDGTPPTVKYSFVSMTGIIDDFIPKISGGTTGNLTSIQTDGTITDSTIASDTVVTKITGGVENNVVLIDANGKIKDSGHGIATDAEFDAMLTAAGLPTVAAS